MSQKDLGNRELVQVCRQGDLERVKSLIDHGADVRFNDDYPLRSASSFGHLEIVKFLVRNGADPQGVNNQPLRFACHNGHLDVVKYLIKQIPGCFYGDLDLGLRWAKEKGHLKVVNYLESIILKEKRLECLKMV